jgi:Uma2 family endonuclease
MAAAAPLRTSLADYRRQERDRETKHEYWQGIVYAMSGGSVTHARLIAEVTALLRELTRGGPCRTYGSTLRLRVDAADLSAYPDAMVICGQPQLHPDDDHEVVNPKIIVEVTSPSTERFDRGAKSSAYRSIPSVTDYLIVSQHAVSVDHFRRTSADAFEVRTLGPGGFVALAGLEGRLSIDELYRDVALEPDTR